MRLSIAPPVGDLTLSLRCNDGSDAFIFSEMFEHKCYDVDLPSSPRTILDAGANIGLAGLFFARKYPDAEIACVEPMPDNVRVLEWNLEANGVNARIVAKALSVEDGTVTMQRAKFDYGHKVSSIQFGKRVTGETLEVAAISVPSLMRDYGWSRIGLLKMDVEGYEGILLRQKCEWLDRVDAMCIECHEEFGEGDLSEVATRHGFQQPRRLSGTWLIVRSQAVV